jgi:hypothetical protein
MGSRYFRPEAEEDPKYLKIVFDDGSVSGEEYSIVTVFSCWHKSHQDALEASGALERGWHSYKVNVMILTQEVALEIFFI